MERRRVSSFSFKIRSFYLEADPKSWKHIGLFILHIEVSVKSRKVVLPYNNMLFVDDDDTHCYYDLLF
jgi:hypothetical protein